MALRLVPHNWAVKTDSYKPSHGPLYDPRLRQLMSFFESRGGEWPYTIFCGLQYNLIENFTVPLTFGDVDYATERWAEHFGTPHVFNRELFRHIVDKHGGYYPIEISAIPEGMMTPTRNVQMTITSTCERCVSMTNYSETLLSHVWDPITVATKSREMKKLIGRYRLKTGGMEGIDYALHDFGYRGVSCDEEAAIAGFAHLINFKGSDTFIANEMIKYYYGLSMASVSIPAAEHSTVMSWGKDETAAYRHAIKTYGNSGSPLYAVVSDTYDLYNAVENIWGGVLKDEVLAAKNTLVIRPDSGTPHKVVRQTVEMLGEKFGFTINKEGYRELNAKVRVIQGDGITYDEVDRILGALEQRRWSAGMVAFGSGGYLLRQANRDTQKHAIKACWGRYEDEDGTEFTRDLRKTPATDPEKWSKAGRLKLVYDDFGTPTTVGIDDPRPDLLQPVFRNGEMLVMHHMDDIRKRAEIDWSRNAD